MLGGLTDGISRAEANLRALPYSLRLSVSAVKRSRARKGADGRISGRESRVCTESTPARSGLRALPTLCAFAVKDWRRSFWSAVLQHRFRFD